MQKVEIKDAVLGLTTEFLVWIREVACVPHTGYSFKLYHT